MVYVGSFDGGDNNAYALNASTGALLWSYATGFTPVVANGVVYIVANKLYAFGLKCLK